MIKQERKKINFGDKLKKIYKEYSESILLVL